jgi:hypothetical protein
MKTVAVFSKFGQCATCASSLTKKPCNHAMEPAGDVLLSPPVFARSGLTSFVPQRYFADGRTLIRIGRGGGTLTGFGCVIGRAASGTSMAWRLTKGLRLNLPFLVVEYWLEQLRTMNSAKLQPPSHAEITEPGGGIPLQHL